MTPPRRLFGIYAMTALLALVYGCAHARAQTPLDNIGVRPLTSAKYPIRLDMMIKELALKDRVQSKLSRELRKLGDIDLLDRGELFTVRVGGQTAKLRDDTEVGYILATVVTRPVMVSSAPSEKGWQTLFFHTPAEWLGMNLYHGSDLDLMCEQIAADFDTHQMEWARKKLGAFFDK